MWHTILHWIQAHGQDYGGLVIFLLLVLGIVGLPVPDEMLLTFAGYLIFKGTLHLVPTAAAALLGSMCGITVSYSLGRWLGDHVIKRYGRKVRLTEERLHKVHDWFHRTGRIVLILGYYIPGVRHLTGIVAGTSKLEWPIFAVFAYTGACLWSATFLCLGYYSSKEWRAVSETAQDYLLIGGGLACVAWLAMYLVRRIRLRRSAAKS